MELIEKELRNSLHNLLMGENSPNNIIITYGVLQYIQDHSKDIVFTKFRHRVPPSNSKVSMVRINGLMIQN